MARVRRSNTASEATLRKMLHRAGYRYRLAGGRGLPGTPDIVLRRHGVAIFVDGCFWHGCPKHGSVPKTNREFWVAKIRKNRQRDKRADRLLQKQGWSVVRVWEHEVRADAERILGRIKALAKP